MYGNLAEYDLNVELFETFDLRVKDIIPVRKVFLVNTLSGDKILKKFDEGLHELVFINEALEYIKKRFKRVIGFNRATNGEIYVKIENQVYCFMDYISGRECEFSNPVDLQIAAKGLSEFHAASKGFKCNEKSKINLGKIINSFEKKLDEVSFFKEIVNKFQFKNQFDEIFLDNVDYYIQEINKAIEGLKASDYLNLCDEPDKIVLCHHDLAHHNILIRDNEAYFVDFDYSIIDIRIHDLCNFISKAIKNSGFDINKTQLILNEYGKESPLDKRELIVLYSLLTFPQDFYDISKSYYTRRKSWEEEVFIYKIKKKISYKEENIEFLKEFNKSIYS